MKTQNIPIVPQFTAFNFVLIILGTSILAIGLHRVYPIMFNRAFKIMNGPLAAFLLVSVIILVTGKHNADSFRKWGENTAIIAGRFMPLMILLCLMMGIGGVLTLIHGEIISSTLEKHRVTGPLIASVLTPTSGTFNPIIERAWMNPVLQPSMLYFLVVSGLVSVPMFFMRQMGFSPDSPLPLKMYVLGAILALLLLPFKTPALWLTDWVCRYSLPALNSTWTAVRAIF